MDAARAAGQEKSARLNVAQERMRKELLRRKEMAASKATSVPVAPVNTPVQKQSADLGEEFASILLGKQGNKKHSKK